jgi:uncharacterized protein
MSSNSFTRRDFLQTSAALTAVTLLPEALRAAPFAPPAAAKNVLEPFDYDGVKLLPSHWQKQYAACRNTYLALPEDDILCGFRRSAGLPAPGKTLGGWAANGTGGIFGQWLSGMARMYRATGDQEILDKALRLMNEWGKTIGPDGNPHMGHYAFEKLSCGLTDLKLYGGSNEAMTLLEKTSDYAVKNLNHDNAPAPRAGNAGRPKEWYTLAENLYRAYQVSGNEKFKAFGDLWIYNDYWGKFANTAAPDSANGVHAYSHVNTFSSAAMAYAVTGDEKYLNIIKNAYDFLQNVQCYATGGFGPSEFIVSNDGGLGRSLDTRTDSFETACGSWAAFKLTRYLLQFTGEARFGDWAERILYNGIGAALPITTDGKNFYYSDYRVTGGMKVYNWERWTCCSGSYIQAVSDYCNIIYYKDADSLYVNLYVPSEVTWKRAAGSISLTQETGYPNEEKITFKLAMAAPTSFPLKFRVPAWAKDATVKVNGTAVSTECKPGEWATLAREWSNGDKVELHIPLPLRMTPVDSQHPDRVAIVRGPSVLVLEAAYHDPAFRLPATDDELNKWVLPDSGAGNASARGVLSAAAGGVPGCFRVQPPDGTRIRSLLRPFYTVEEAYPYKIYFDTKSLPIKYW